MFFCFLDLSVIELMISCRWEEFNKEFINIDDGVFVEYKSEVRVDFVFRL